MLARAGDFALTVLCLDEAVETELRNRSLPRVYLLLLAVLTANYPALAAARSDRTADEFSLTCKSWLVHHALPRIPAGELLTYVDASLYLFGSPQSIYDEIGAAAVAVTPCRYPPALAPWARAHGVSQPTVPAHCEQAWHMYYLLLPTLAARTALIAHLKSRGILAVFHYLPLHLSEYARQWGGRPGDCPVTEDVSDRLLRLPFFNAMTTDQQSRVITAVQEFTRA
jgi:hypothetical protein